MNCCYFFVEKCQGKIIISEEDICQTSTVLRATVRHKNSIETKKVLRSQIQAQHLQILHIFTNYFKFKLYKLKKHHKIPIRCLQQ